MTIFNDTFIPIEFPTPRKTFDYIVERSMSIRRSIRFVQMEPDSLTLRLPGSGEYIEVEGTEEDVLWLHTELAKRDYYRIT